jgi:AraC-like DNA-binding protein
MIAFGPRSTFLAAGMAFGAIVATLLILSRRNAVANRILAALILVVVFKLSPYGLGFAGFFDSYPWLSFVPVSFGLALGPLTYLYVARITSRGLPRRWAWHFVPVASQFAYYLSIFIQPLAFKNRWSEQVHAPWIDPAETWLELISFASYLVLALRRYHAYQAWLDATLSNREQFRLRWLRNTLIILLAVLPVWVGFELVSAILQLDYFERMPLYVLLTGLIGYLGLEGWRNADIALPVRPAMVAVAATPEPPAEKDWAAIGERWRTLLADRGWWRDPDLDLASLARHLGSNTSYVSRALNEGLGRNFNSVVNELRVDAAKARIRRSEGGADLMAIATAVGFNSKTSFNRWFRICTGTSPTQWRRENQSRTKSENSATDP